MHDIFQIMQVIYEKFRVAFKKDKVTICQAVYVSGNIHARRLQKLSSASTLLEPIVVSSILEEGPCKTLTPYPRYVEQKFGPLPALTTNHTYRI